MKSIFLVMTVFSISVTAFSKEQLQWTDSADSVQAILWDALLDAKSADDASKYPNRFIQFSEKGDLIVDDSVTNLTCSSKSFGLTAVQSYSCTLSNNEMPWTDNAASVQAIIWSALIDAKMADDASKYPSGYIKFNGSGELVVEDENATLTCDSKSFGMTAVQSYKCIFENK